VVCLPPVDISVRPVNNSRTQNPRNQSLPNKKVGRHQIIWRGRSGTILARANGWIRSAKISRREEKELWFLSIDNEFKTQDIELFMQFETYFYQSF
jgi:hypothetical protein